MRLIDKITVRHSGKDRALILARGDLAAVDENPQVDSLVVSAFPDDYTPTPDSLIGALYRNGISVESLATDKAVDLRQFSSCWLSNTIPEDEAYFRRLLCFEPEIRGQPHEFVGDVFRSIIPFASGEGSINTIAMPLLAAGDQGEDPAKMLEATVEAAINWLRLGLDVKRIYIVIRDSARVESLRAIFASAKNRHQVQETPDANYQYDAFVSYSRTNKEAVDLLVQKLRQFRPSVKLFVDRLELNPGASWQQHIFESLDEARKVICVYSPRYLESKVCKEEFNMALFRHRETPNGVLIPVYLQSAKLPTYMKLVQYHDAREGELEKLATVAGAIAEDLYGATSDS